MISIIIIAICASTLFVFLKAYTCALAHVPGPHVSRWTSWWLKVHVLRGQRLHYIHRLHQQYGPVVRISPNEVAIADLESTRAIHKIGSGFLKSPWYAAFNESVGIFAMSNPEEHAARRKLLAQPFSKSNVLTSATLVRAKADLVVSKIKREIAESSDKAADVLKWFTFMATDVVGELSFGDSFRMLEQGKKNDYIRDLETVMLISGLNVELSLLIRILSALQVPVFARAANMKERLTSYGTASIQRHKRMVLAGAHQPTFFTKFFSDKSQGLSDAAIEQEASNLIVAGSDTTAVTLTYLVWAVLKDSSIHKRLLAELSGLSLPMEYNELESNQYLNAVLDESLRLYGAAPGGLPRIVPAAGCTLAGHYIPPGTTVTTQAYSLHRDASIFKNPECLDPERWYSPSPAMRNAFMPFGAGSRVCLGVHLARLELLVTAARFFLELPTAKLDSGMKDGDMDFENYFLITPKSHRCLVTEN